MTNPLTKGLRPIHPGEMLREDILPAVGRPKTEIARLLGISRNILRAQLKRFGLLPGRDVADMEDLGESARLADGVDVEGAVVGT